MKKEIKAWKEATEAIAKVFTKKYFPDEEYRVDTYWVGDEVGGVYCVADRFFNVDRMIEALELGATYEQISEYEDLELEHIVKECKRDKAIDDLMENLYIVKDSQGCIFYMLQQPHTDYYRIQIIKKNKPITLINFKNFVKYGKGL